MSRPTDAHATTTEGTMQDRLDDQLDQRHHDAVDPTAAEPRDGDPRDPRGGEAGGPGGWGGQGNGHDGGAPAQTPPTAHPQPPDPNAAGAGAAQDGSRAARLSEPSAVSQHEAERTALIPRQRASDYQDRWQVLKAQFVDEPRTAVRDANELVGQVLDEIEETFRTQRSDLERDLHDDAASTEDLRLALGRYRTFFDRLLNF
ncbi:hypothetical protein PSU4_04020 [Pseudonocardia sulfidoxydans NBRC 16205]|uniref:Uncharacterized protein n=1 Tax=Pseudonocardia sulfidoxydans NBRC 16205 TaxID=1223511 RepID=A0A511DEP7_9PSEU|nr:hypothetical protein [Pseudonocardia sulfidoxydans]GEL21448.1 hypothetical protein PSU4_04020 [Pseudonocardia sulfidoxydans NBRC 16205]